MTGVNAALAGILLLPLEQVSLKRAAWAYGCAKKGSKEEEQLLDLLLRVLGIVPEKKP